MQASTVDTPTAGHCGTIFVAIELSQKSWLVTLHSPDRDRISRHKLEGGDHTGLLALLAKVGERASLKLGAVPKVVSCYEAGYDGFWLHRLLTEAGIGNFVFDPASIAVEQRARRAPDRPGSERGAGGRPARQPRTRSTGHGADGP
jgi:transposase